MIYTFRIDDSSEKAKAFLRYIKSLDFVQVEDKDIVLSEKQKKELDKRRKNAKPEDFLSLKDVNRRLNNKYGL